MPVRALDAYTLDPGIIRMIATYSDYRAANLIDLKKEGAAF